VIAPPPAIGGSGQSRSGGSMVALSLHPAVGSPPTPVAGNRRGTFATTPEGHRGATGAPGNSTGESAAGAAGAGSGKATGSGSGKNGYSNLPSGLYVGKTSAPTSAVAGDPAPKSNTSSVNPNLIASARTPSLSRTPRAESDDKISEAERAVFGGRKIYSLSLNMPNLNSAGGSWIIRFAALDQDPTPSHAASGDAAAPDLSSPVAMRKVDPAYPLELMRHHLGGTVILYAVIHADGTVGNVRVLRSVDERLDQFASEALAKWQFQPARKNGAPVDVEATFWIPFRPARVGITY
jgi:TonB family protein